MKHLIKSFFSILVYSTMVYILVCCNQSEVENEETPMLTKEEMIACGIKNPTQNIQWLKGIIEDIEKRQDQNPTCCYGKIELYKDKEAVNYIKLAIDDASCGAFFCEWYMSCDGDSLFTSPNLELFTEKEGSHILYEVTYPANSQ